MSLTGDKGMSVEVEEIDNQHKHLIEIMNTLYDVLFAKRKNDAIKEIFSNLLEYASLHFKTEEDYFDKFHFPEAEIHKRSHASFTKKIHALNAQFKKGAYDPTIDLVSYLEEWLTSHLMDIDKKYVKCFHENGLY